MFARGAQQHGKGELCQAGFLVSMENWSSCGLQLHLHDLFFSTGFVFSALLQ